MPRKSTTAKIAELPAELISMREAAARYHIHHDTVRRKISEGKLTGYKFGQRVMRVNPAEVAALFQVIPTHRNSVEE
jgi:excisionase family DNA binding protein